MKLVSFGEIMLRLTPPGSARILQTSSFNATFGGAEANVAAAYALLGGEATYVTALPDNALGHAARNSLRAVGVDTSFIRFEGPRLGTYYLECGAALRPSQVIYDRAGSSVATVPAAGYRWEEALAGADWFFFTGITAALGETVREALADALAACRRLGVRVACDLNYRAKLWSYADAAATMTALVQGLDLLIVNEEHAEKVLGIPSCVAPEYLGKGYETELIGRRQNAARMAKELRTRFEIGAVAMTLRTTLTSDDTVTGALYTDGQTTVESPDYVSHAVDRVGSGDAYSAGLLFALSRGDAADAANRFGAATCALAHTIPGDFTYLTAAEVENLVRHGGSRIQR